MFIQNLQKTVINHENHRLISQHINKILRFHDTMIRTNQKYTITSIGLLTVLTMALIPGSISLSADDAKFYGAAEMVLYNIQGDEKFRQTVHNQLVDSGETFLLIGAFADGTAAVADSLNIGTICVTDATLTIDETDDAAVFQTSNTLDGNALSNCIESTGVTYLSGVATLGELTFTAGSAGNIPATSTINGIGVCQNTGSDHAGCSGAADGSGTSVLFAEVVTSSVTLADGESVDITYTFDISSSST